MGRKGGIEGGKRAGEARLARVERGGEERREIVERGKGETGEE